MKFSTNKTHLHQKNDVGNCGKREKPGRGKRTLFVCQKREHTPNITQNHNQQSPKYHPPNTQQTLITPFTTNQKSRRANLESVVSVVCCAFVKVLSVFVCVCVCVSMPISTLILPSFSHSFIFFFSLTDAKIVAVMHNTGLFNGVGAVSVINTYYGREDVPIGAYKGPFAANETGKYVLDLVQNFPSPIKNYSQVG